MAVYEKILALGFLTGSRAWGLENKASSGSCAKVKESDYDICIRIEDFEDAKQLLESQNYPTKESHYFNGLKGKVDYKDVNIIPLAEEDYGCWFLATEAFKPIVVALNPSLKKSQRHGVFQGIVQLIKSTGVVQVS